MNTEEILQSVVPMATETKLKAWIFQVDKKFYHVAEYGGVYRVPATTAIWESNKKGKRLSDSPIYKIDGQNHMKCINQFLEMLEEKEIEASIAKESESK